MKKTRKSKAAKPPKVQPDASETTHGDAWRSVRDTLKAFPMIAPSLAEYEQWAGDGSVMLWLGAALHEFIHSYNDVDRERAVFAMIDHAGEKLEVMG